METGLGYIFLINNRTRNDLLFTWNSQILELALLKKNHIISQFQDLFSYGEKIPKLLTTFIEKNMTNFIKPFSTLFQVYGQLGTGKFIPGVHSPRTDKLTMCAVCGKDLQSPAHLRRHMKVHSGERPYSCALCLKAFANLFNLYNHRRNVHVGCLPYQCLECIASFASLTDLKVHKQASGHQRKQTDHSTILPQKENFGKTFGFQRMTLSSMQALH